MLSTSRGSRASVSLFAGPFDRSVAALLVHHLFPSACFTSLFAPLVCSGLCLRRSDGAASDLWITPTKAAPLQAHHCAPPSSSISRVHPPPALRGKSPSSTSLTPPIGASDESHASQHDVHLRAACACTRSQYLAQDEQLRLSPQSASAHTASPVARPTRTD
jgi:hypothetical protein